MMVDLFVLSSLKLCISSGVSRNEWMQFSSAHTFFFLFFFDLCSFESETVSVFEVNYFMHPELDLYFPVNFPLKSTSESGSTYDKLQLSFWMQIGQGFMLWSFWAFFFSLENVGSSLTFGKDSRILYWSIVVCEMVNLFKICAIYLPLARKALGDHGDTDTQNFIIPKPVWNSFLFSTSQNIILFVSV